MQLSRTGPTSWRHFWAPIPWMLETTIALQVATGERLEASMIAALLLLNVALGVFQENRAGAALALLKQQLALKARVRRDGRLIEVPAADLVPGDIVQLSLGSIVPADARILVGGLLLDQSMLTGESIPTEAERDKVAYAGGIVRRGEAIAEIIATGARTYFGRAAELVRTAHVESSEQHAVLGVVRNLTIVNFAIIIGIVAYAHAIAMSTTRVIPLVLTALLSAVPVTLPATFTLAATLGAKTLAFKGVLVTRLSALHEAAMIDVLCADKTGTLTLNELAVSAVRGVSDGYSEAAVLSLAALASSPDGPDPVDTVIRSMARQGGIPLPLKVVRFIPFDPAVKMAEAAARDPSGSEIRIVKGAPAAIAAVAPMNPEIAVELQSLASAGYRILAVACGPPGKMALAGLIAFGDPPRPDSRGLLAELDPWVWAQSWSPVTLRPPLRRSREQLDWRGRSVRRDGSPIVPAPTISPCMQEFSPRTSFDWSKHFSSRATPSECVATALMTLPLCARRRWASRSRPRPMSPRPRRALC